MKFHVDLRVVNRATKSADEIRVVIDAETASLAMEAGKAAYTRPGIFVSAHGATPVSPGEVVTVLETPPVTATEPEPVAELTEDDLMGIPEDIRPPEADEMDERPKKRGRPKKAA